MSKINKIVIKLKNLKNYKTSHLTISDFNLFLHETHQKLT